MATGYHRTAHLDDLTKRQREVLALVAEGKTNIEIAESLGIGFESAKTHVSEILARLGVESREEAAAAWRADQGLLARLRRTATGFFVTGFGKAAAGAMAALVVVAGVSAAVYVGGDGGDGSLAADDEPTVVVPAPTVAAAADPQPAGPQPDASADWEYGLGDLHEARLDLAGRLGVDPLEVDVWSMKPAAWDGCIGVYTANRACLAPLVHGHIVDFEAGLLLYRYHVGFERFVAVDWTKDATIDEGQEFFDAGKPAPLPDSSREFRRPNAMAAGELELRTGVDREQWSVTAIDHVTFADSCLGFESQPAIACDVRPVPGAIVDFEHGTETHRYHVSLEGIVAVDFEPGKALVEPDPVILQRTLEMREHLAKRLSIPVSAVAVEDQFDVVWGDTCLAIWYRGTTCTKQQIDGYWASFSAGGYSWTYHGTDAGFEHAGPPAEETTGIGTWVRRRD